MTDLSLYPKIPIGKSNWGYMRDNNYLLVDKTELLGQLVAQYDNVFITRPPRFGKTTMLSTLEDLFNHGDVNFKGKKIYGNWPVDKTYPVIRLSFLNVNSRKITPTDTSSFEDSLKTTLARAYRKAGFKEADDFKKEEASLEDFLSRLSDISDEYSLVFLIDEWDHPLSNYLDDEAKFNAIRDVLSVFYAWHRSLDNVKFTLITGIMRYKDINYFTRGDVFDISLNPDFASLLGYTQSDIETTFAPHIEEAARRLNVTREQFLAELKYYYNGFCFDSDATTKVYCPWSVNCFFNQLTSNNTEQEPYFENFWMQSSGEPTSLRTFLNRVKPNYSLINQIISDGAVLTWENLKSPQTFSKVEFLSLLTLNGYLSIHSIKEPVAYLPSNRSFICRFPNQEVSLGFSRIFLQYAIDTALVRPTAATSLGTALFQDDIASACIYLNEMLSDLLSDILKSAQEIQYRALIASTINFCGYQVREETDNRMGRSDIEIEIPEPNHHVDVIELKILPQAQSQESAAAKRKLLDEAQAQILSRGYGVNRFTHGLHVVGIALVISPVSRQIVAWRKIDNQTGIQEGEVAPLTLLNKPEY